MNRDAADGKRKRTQTTAAEGSQKKKNEAFKNSTKAKATFEEGDQVISMSAEGQESEFLESDDDDESNIVTFRNRPEEAEYPTEDEETNETPKSDPQSDGEEPMDFEHEVHHQNEDGEILSDEEENFKALKKVQKLMAKEGFKDSAKFLKRHIKKSRKSSDTMERRSRSNSPSHSHRNSKGKDEFGGKRRSSLMKRDDSRDSKRGKRLRKEYEDEDSFSEVTVYRNAVKRNSSSSEDDVEMLNIDVHEYVAGHPLPGTSRGRSETP